MDREERNKTDFLAIPVYILIILSLIIIGMKFAKGQEITEQQQQEITEQGELYGVIDPNRKQLNKNIKTKDLDLAEDLSYIYGKLEYLQKVCER